MTPVMLQALADIQDAIQATFVDYGLDTVIEIDDANGFMEMVVDVDFYNDASVQLSFNLETGQLITGEDSEEPVDDAAIWRRLAFGLAQQIA